MIYVQLNNFLLIVTLSKEKHVEVIVEKKFEKIFSCILSIFFSVRKIFFCVAMVISCLSIFPPLKFFTFLETRKFNSDDINLQKITCFTFSNHSADTYYFLRLHTLREKNTSFGR